jgi:hypothetical protein
VTSGAGAELHRPQDRLVHDAARPEITAIHAARLQPLAKRASIDLGRASRADVDDVTSLTCIDTARRIE